MAAVSEDAALRSLREEVLAANLDLPRHGLVTLTWGNVSAVNRDRALVAIKPSGIGYADMTAEDIVVVSLDDGSTVVGSRRPSTDTPTHVALYRAFDDVGGIVHTHSTWATAWAQAGREIPLLGTTHADLMAGAVPVTRQLTPEEVASGYEEATGAVLIEAVGERDALDVPCVLARGHAPFCWGASAAGAVEAALTLEEVARMATLTTLLDPAAAPLVEHVREKHYERKHGAGAYYGQG